MVLQKLLGKVYVVVVEVLLYLIILAGGVAGAIMFSQMDLPAVLGVIVGLVIGFIADLVILGPFVLVLDIRNSLRKIEDKNI